MTYRLFWAKGFDLRVLVISHSSAQVTYHRKFEEISKYNKIQLRVLIPHKWVENTIILYAKTYEKGNLSFHSGKVTFPGYGSRFFFLNGIIKHFYEFKPHIIHLEEEPWSLCALQVLILRRIFCPKSKLIFRTSLSIPAKQKLDFIVSKIEKLMFKEADYAFILSKRAGDILIQKGYRKGMKISPNGVDSKLFRKIGVNELREKLSINPDDFVIGYVGRLMKMKGLDTLLKAFASITAKDALKLLIVGSGDYKQDMLSLASQLNIKEKMILIDAVPAEDVPKYMNCMNVLVLPSITTPGWVEFFGRVLVEAMMCDVAVIGSSSGEIPNVVADSGLIFQEGNEIDLKDKLEMLIDDDNLRHTLIKRGKARASSLFTWESIAKDTYDLYCSLLD